MWAPVVYGRTRRVDRWWRAMPAGLDADFAEDVVRAAAAGGRALEEGQRFVLAQCRRARIVGGVCLSRELSATMNSDEINRPLYCFVGWAAVDQESLPDVPSISDLTHDFADWAHPVYEQWMGLDWDLHESQVSGPHISEPVLTPWEASEAPSPSVTERSPYGETVAWPEEQAAAPWDLLRSASRPGLVVSGWHRLADADVPAGTWIVCGDVTEKRVLDAPAPEPRPDRRSRMQDEFELPRDHGPSRVRRQAPAGGAKAATGRPHADVRDGMAADRAPSRPESRDQRMRREAWRLAGRVPPTDDELDRASAIEMADDELGSRDPPRQGRRIGFPHPKRLLDGVMDVFREPDSSPDPDGAQIDEERADDRRAGPPDKHGGDPRSRLG